MKKNKFILNITAFSFILLALIACDKDYTNLESDIITNDNATSFNILSQPYDVITYTKALDPVQTNNLTLNTLGVYDDVYGRTTSSFVTQLTTTTFDPDFGDGVAIDSVVLTLPFFSTVTEIDEDGNVSYDLDSVFPKVDDAYKPFKLSLYESNYFIRDFDPNGTFDETQLYFSDKSVSETETISDGILESTPIAYTYYNIDGTLVTNNILEITNKGYVLTESDDDDEDDLPQVLQRQAPSIRLLLEPTYWQNKILNQEGQTVLSSESNFAEYFRGLYFKVEPVNNDGTFLILDTSNQNANITIYYTRLTTSTTDEDDATEQATFILRFGANKINFMDNGYTLPFANGDENNGDSRLYLKGGEGAIAKIKLFDGFYDEDAGITNFEKFRTDFVTLENDTFVSPKRLVNEANLVFYVDQDIVNGGEPNRIYLYDDVNKTPLIDYFLDGASANFPEFSIANHLGSLQREGEEANGKGIKYKLKITEHINNLLLRDSTNVELGLAVSVNVNLEELLAQRQVRTDDDTNSTLPISSIITPRGTVLHGNTTEDETKKVQLEIYYTELEN